MSKDGKAEDDDYVARLLAEDAKKSSQRYASLGLSALLPGRSTKAAPKPNTRFLSQIVRQADNHNAALKKKEELESKLRLRQMRKREERQERQQDEDGRERKRRRTKTEDDSSHRRRRSGDRQRHRSPRDDKKKDNQERDMKPHKRDTGREHHSSTHRKRSDDQERRPRHQSKSTSARTESKRTDNDRHRSKRHKSLSSESDPLEDLVGPLPSKSAPPVQIRGRGAHKPHRSNIDTHFSSTYDPNLDVQPDRESASDGEDWDMALEAVRDRAMWKKKQSTRMREAGFGDDEIKKWEGTAAKPGKSGVVDGDVGSVRWAKKGEAREWDLGKKGLDDDDDDDD